MVFISFLYQTVTFFVARDSFDIFLFFVTIFMGSHVMRAVKELVSAVFGTPIGDR